MWIRSQDKSTLLNVNLVRIHDCGDRCLIIGSMDRYEYELSLYSTKEKALKVLGEIQNAISDSVIINGKLYCSPRRSNESHATTTKRNVIYIMPLDDEVEV